MIQFRNKFNKILENLRGRDDYVGRYHGTSVNTDDERNKNK